MAKKPKKIESEIKSHFGFGEHWNELPQYQGYVPPQYKNRWQDVKNKFCDSGNYSDERPLPVNIQKDATIIVVNVYGFKIPDSPPVLALGNDVITDKRVVLCKTITTKEHIAIRW